MANIIRINGDSIKDTQARADISELRGEIENIEPGLSDDAKAALLNCFQHVAWIDDKGQTYYDALEDALYPSPVLSRITAVFTQGTFEVYMDTPLDDLRPYLVVMAYYTDGTSSTISDYTLSGNLEVGTSIITVNKTGKTATFEVTVVQEPGVIYYLPSITEFNGVDDYVDTGIQLMKTKQSYTIVIDFSEDNGQLATDQYATLFHCMFEDEVHYVYPGVSFHFAGQMREGASYKLYQASYNYNTTASTSFKSVYGELSNVSLGRIRLACSVNTSQDTLTVYLMVNGNTIGGVATNIHFASINETLLIGAYRTQNDVKGRFFKGTINEFKIYDHAFSEDECLAYIAEV